MAQAAFQQTPAATQADRSGAASGGPIADMQRTIEERMTVGEWQSGAFAPADADIAHRFSRAAGPTLLAIAYAVVALWWF